MIEDDKKYLKEDVKNYMKNTKLVLGDFVRIGIQGSLGHYFSHILSDGKEICLEACMNGYCIAIYDKKNGNLMGNKICTNLEGYELSFMGLFNIRTGEALEKAINIVNNKTFKN